MAQCNCDCFKSEEMLFLLGPENRKLKTDCAQGGTKCAKRQMGFIDSEGSERYIKAQNVRCFVAKLHLSRFIFFFRGNIPIL